jgi:uncharacterized cupredoxin-like copper-binding protein
LGQVHPQRRIQCSLSLALLKLALAEASSKPRRDVHNFEIASDALAKDYASRQSLAISSEKYYPARPHSLSPFAIGRSVRPTQSHDTGALDATAQRIAQDLFDAGIVAGPTGTQLGNDILGEARWRGLPGGGRRNGRGAGSECRSPFFFGLPPLAAGERRGPGRQDGLGCVSRGFRPRGLSLVSLWDKGSNIQMATDFGYPATGKDMSKATMGIAVNTDTVKAGEVTFEVLNSSAETIHEFIVARLKDVNKPLPYLASDSKVDEDKADVHLGEVSELDPGKTGALRLDLKPGNYLLYCDIPGTLDRNRRRHANGEVRVTPAVTIVSPRSAAL